jgi:hypothetical protein
VERECIVGERCKGGGGYCQGVSFVAVYSRITPSRETEKLQAKDLQQQEVI